MIIAIATRYLLIKLQARIVRLAAFLAAIPQFRYIMVEI